MNEIRHPVADADLVTSPYFTAAEFDRMNACGAFEDLWVELVDGVIEKMVPPGLDHGAQMIALGAKLLSALTGQPLRIAADLGVRIDTLTVRAIDVAVVDKDAPSQGSVPADRVFLAIEIAETTRARDLGAKVRDYARGGIPHYWVVDGPAKVVHVFGMPEGDGYTETKITRFGEELNVPGTNQSIVVE